MTALERYTRLEAVGQWKETPDADAREVIVSFGDATLILSDFDENPLSHWAMAAVRRVDQGGGPALYTPDFEGFETLEIADDDMIEAIAMVSNLATVRPRRRPVLRWVALAFVLAAIGLGALYGPAQLRRQAADLTSFEGARQIGFAMIRESALSICTDPRGQRALGQWQAMVFPEDRTRLVIARNAPARAVFPGGLVVIGVGALRALPDAGALSAWVGPVSSPDSAAETLVRLFSDAALADVVQYVTRGTLPERALASAASEILDNAPQNVSAALLSGAMEMPVLSDQEWVALQGICLD